MVYIQSELMYDNQIAGYRCIINKGAEKAVVDISAEEYRYIYENYGKMYYRGIYEGKEIYREYLHLNDKGYLETGTESLRYLAVDGFRLVENEILSEVKKEILEMQRDSETIKYLRAKYDMFNIKYFSGVLPSSMRILLNRRYTKTGGAFTWYSREPYRNNISISTKYMEKYPEEIDNTLVHEMIHVLMFERGYLKEGHGRRFKAEMERINRMGMKVTQYVENSFSDTKYSCLVQCNRCGNFTKYKRKPKYALNNYFCTRCRGNIRYVYRQPFYMAYMCEECGELFFADDVKDLRSKQYCPCCNVPLKEV